MEYQTLRRLPKTGSVLFTIRTMTDPLSALEGRDLDDPWKSEGALAAGCLAASVRGLSPYTSRYKGLRDGQTVTALLAYLDQVAASSALPQQ